MTEKDRKNKNSTLKLEIPPPKVWSDLVDVGGIGGLLKIFFSLLAWFCLAFSKSNFDALIWNTIILNIPCFIDVLDFKVPSNVSTDSFKNLRGGIIAGMFLFILFSSGLILAPVVIEGVNLDNDFVKGCLKAFASLSVISSIFSYAGKVYTEKSRLQQAEGRQGTTKD